MGFGVPSAGCDAWSSSPFARLSHALGAILSLTQGALQRRATLGGLLEGERLERREDCWGEGAMDLVVCGSGSHLLTQ